MERPRGQVADHSWVNAKTPQILWLLLTVMLVLRCLLEVLSPWLKLCYFGSSVTTCAIDSVIVTIGTLKFCLYGMAALQLKKNLQYNYFQCNKQSVFVLGVSCLSLLHIIGMFILVRSFWMTKLSIVFQVLHLVPSTTVALEVSLQGVYLVCRLNEQRRETQASEQSLARLLGSSNLVFIAYLLTMLVVVCYRWDSHFVLEVVVIFVEIIGRAYRILLLKHTKDRASCNATTPVQAQCCALVNTEVVKLVVQVACKRLHYVPSYKRFRDHRRSPSVAESVDQLAGSLNSKVEPSACTNILCTDLPEDLNRTQLQSAVKPFPYNK